MTGLFFHGSQLALQDNRIILFRGIDWIHSGELTGYILLTTYQYKFYQYCMPFLIFLSAYENSYIHTEYKNCHAGMIIKKCKLKLLVDTILCSVPNLF